MVKIMNGMSERFAYMFGAFLLLLCIILVLESPFVTNWLEQGLEKIEIIANSNADDL